MVAHRGHSPQVAIAFVEADDFRLTDRNQGNGIDLTAAAPIVPDAKLCGMRPMHWPALSARQSIESPVMEGELEPVKPNAERRKNRSV